MAQLRERGCRLVELLWWFNLHRQLCKRLSQRKRWKSFCRR